MSELNTSAEFWRSQETLAAKAAKKFINRHDYDNAITYLTWAANYKFYASKLTEEHPND